MQSNEKPPRRDRSGLLMGGVVALVLGVGLFMVMRSGSGPNRSLNGEFPREWFAPMFPGEDAQLKLLGQPMPPLELTQWHNGPVSMEDLKGKVVVIDFWATWCAPCLAEFGNNNQLYAKTKPKGVELIGVCTSTMQNRYESVIAEKQPKYPMGRDEMLITMNAWGVKSFPTYAVVDRKGRVRAIGLYHEYIEKVVEKLLAEPAS